VLVVHGRDENRVDIFAIKNGAIVAGGRDTGIVDCFLSGDVAAVIQVADGDALNARNLEGSLKVFASADAGADGGEAYGVAGSDRTARGGKQVGLQDRFGDRSGGESAGAKVNELTTGQGILCHEILRL
jgi:hypothetical protein